MLKSILMSILPLLAFGLGALASSPAFGQPSASGRIKPAPAQPRFEIRAFEIIGNRRLTDAALAARVSRFVGPNREFADIQNAIAAVRAAYVEQGLSAVQVMLPEQSVDNGVVRLRVVEGKLAKVRVEGQKFSSEAKVRRALPALREGAMPDSNAIAANLRLANEHPSRQTTVVLRSADITITPLSISWSGVWRAPTTDMTGYLSALRNIPDLFGPSSDADFKASRANARAAFRALRFGTAVTQALPADLQVRASFTGQYTQDALVAGEQFGIGGFDSVRGFFERAVAGDRGLRGTLELYSPDFGQAVERSVGTVRTLRVRAVAFYDAGSVTRNHPQPGESQGESIASAGAGLRLSAMRNLSVRLDAAQVLEGGGGLPRHAVRVQGSVAYVY